jgi:hypothetical protein
MSLPLSEHALIFLHPRTGVSQFHRPLKFHSLSCGPPTKCMLPTWMAVLNDGGLQGIFLFFFFLKVISFNNLLFSNGYIRT